MKLYYIGFCVWILFIVAMATGCSEFEMKIEEMKKLVQQEEEMDQPIVINIIVQVSKQKMQWN